MLIIFCGLPGSGKSYLASLLASKLKLNYLSTDIIRKKKSFEKAYTEDNKFIVYGNMLSQAVRILSQGKDLIVDGTFYKESLRNMFCREADSKGHSTKFIYVFAKEETIRKRLQVKRKYSEADFAIYIKVKKSFDPLKGDYLLINSEEEDEGNTIKKIISYIYELHGDR